MKRKFLQQAKATLEYAGSIFRYTFNVYYNIIKSKPQLCRYLRSDASLYLMDNRLSHFYFFKKVYLAFLKIGARVRKMFKRFTIVSVLLYCIVIVTYCKSCFYLFLMQPF